MRGFITFFGVLLVVLSATWAYRVNYRTQDVMSEVARLQRQIVKEREAISVLNAEWAYLNRPERLQALVTTHYAALQLDAITASQYADIGKVSYPSPEDPLLDTLIAAAVAQVMEETR